MHVGDYDMQPERLTGPADVVEEFIICQPCMAEEGSHYFPLVISFAGNLQRSADHNGELESSG